MEDLLQRPTPTNPQPPIDITDLRSQNAMLLTSIDSELSNDTVSEAILDSLEKLEQIYRQHNIQITEWMKDAYRAVALHCSFRRLLENFHPENGNSPALESFLDARVSKLEMLNSELPADVFRDCGEAFRVLLSSSDALNNWKEKSAEFEYYALTLTRFFVRAEMSELVENNESEIDKEAKEDEIRAESHQTMATVEDFLQGKAESSMEGKDRDLEERGIEGVECNHSEVAIAKQKGKMLLHKPAASRRRYEKPAKIVDSDDSDLEIVPSQMDASEVKQQSLVIPLDSSDVLQGSVEAEVSNPLIDESLEIRFDSPKSSDANQGSVKEAVSSPVIDESLENPVDNLRTSNVKQSSGKAAVSDSSMDESCEIHLDSPKRIDVSPLKIYKDVKITRRRKNKPWTPEEEDALREGVKKYGEGNWKKILNANSSMFSERLEVDLKDKWRNLNKWGKMSHMQYQ